VILLVKIAKYHEEQNLICRACETFMDVSIIGSGVVGQATGTGLAEHGNQVTFNDIDEGKLSLLESQGYKVTKSIVDAVKNSEVIFVCVPTPTNDNHMDLSFVKSVIGDLGKGLQETSRYTVVVFKSTILPQTTRNVLVPMLEESSGLKAGKDFGVCMNPEFLRENSPFEDFLNPDRVIVGELDQKSGDIMEKLYCPFNCPIIRTDLDTAEMIKYVSNLYLASKISFFNEVFLTCKSLGLDAHTISEAASLDPRIGKYGIYGGKPYGGKCFPKDMAAFLAFAKSNNLDIKILDAVNEVNKIMASLAEKEE
jgi:UDPglucose 6-dehydrogenase